MSEHERHHYAQTVAPQHVDTHREPPPVSKRSVTLVVIVAIVIAVVLAVIGVLARLHSRSELKTYTGTVAAPPVSLAIPGQSSGAQEIVIPGNMQAFVEAPIYARTTGYVKAWYHDIGTHVKKGDLMAVIETPELDQQLAQAKADLSTAIANAGLAKTTASRYQGLISQNAVSQQDTDNAVSALTARNTEVSAAQANVQRLQELVGFEHVTSPFDGVVTARNIDIGQLISAQGSTNTAGAGVTDSSKPVFTVSSIGTLRVFVNVPQMYSPDAKAGTIATLTLPQFAGRSFQGKLVRNAAAVDPTTRTLLAEVDVDNRDGQLLPGSYTEVHLHVSGAAPALLIPVSALMLEPDGLRVGVVDANNKAHMVRVTPGRDFGTNIEILSGLQKDQKVIANPPDSLTDGETVRVVGTPVQTKVAK